MANLTMPARYPAHIAYSQRIDRDRRTSVGHEKAGYLAVTGLLNGALISLALWGVILAIVL